MYCTVGIRTKNLVRPETMTDSAFRSINYVRSLVCTDGTAVYVHHPCYSDYGYLSQRRWDCATEYADQRRKAKRHLHLKVLSSEN
jgi:hypothetical protein